MNGVLVFFLAAFVFQLTTSNPTAKYGGTHFVKWDNREIGGRWFECTIGTQWSDGRYLVRLYDYDYGTGTFRPNEISILGVESTVGDQVLAYWEGSHYAYKGIHGATDSHGKIWVEFDDGINVLTESSAVYKFVTL